MQLASTLVVFLAAATALAPVSGQCTAGITSFTLIAADTNTELGPLDDFDFSVNDPSFLYNVRANVNECPGETIDSVQFVFDDIPGLCEEFTPYAWVGDPSTQDLGAMGDFDGVPIAPGMHKLQAIPFAGPGCTGQLFNALEEPFQVCTDDCPGKITGFTLIDPIANVDVGPLSSFDFTNTQGPINVRADYESCQAGGGIESVQFYVDGVQFRCENYTPYSLFGDDNPLGPDLGLLGPFFDGYLGPGVHKILAVPHKRNNCKGPTGCPLEETVQVQCPECPGTVTSFTVIDTSDDSEMGSLASIDYANLQGPINVRANVEACPTANIDSVAFYLDGTFARCEIYSPYSLFGDENPDGPDLGNIGPFYDGFFGPGPHKLVAVPFEGPECTGTAGCPFEEDFNIECADCPGAVTGFTLIDAVSDTEIGPLEHFDFQDLTTSQLNIRADIDECTDHSIKSVQFFFDGMEVRCENYTPYALAGDVNPNGPDLGPLGQFYSASIAVGAHTITAVPFSGNGCTGDAGCPLVQQFTAVTTGCPGYVSGFSLWSARSQRKLGPITDGAFFCRSQVRGPLAIQAETVSCSDGSTSDIIDSVSFSGSFSGTDSSSDDKYMYPANLNVGVLEWIRGVSMRPGQYEVSATPSSTSASGTTVEGVSHRVTFTIGRC